MQNKPKVNLQLALAHFYKPERNRY